MNDARSEPIHGPAAAQPPAEGLAAQLVEHFFRHESGRLVAVLARLFGLRHLDLVEEMVQSALVEALAAWRTGGVPDNPSAWMHAVARNKILDALRHREVVLRLAPARARLRPAVSEPELDDMFLDSRIEDSQLRLVFACCHPALDRTDQIALTLKHLCGFTSAEIARGLLVTEEAVKKRLQRARVQLVQRRVELTVPPEEELPRRLDAVHQCLYLLFNEGYSATHGDTPLREDLCEEAARLCHLLCGHPSCATPASFALLALMLFHAARFYARTGAGGEMLLLEEQDRGKWDRALIERARQFLDRASEGTRVSTYHLEAGIALIHCTAVSFDQTDWRAILKIYDVLVHRDRSPICLLNRAVAVAHLDGWPAGISELESLAGQPALANYPLYDGLLGELYRRAGDFVRARKHLLRARERTGSAFERELLDRRLAMCE